MMLYKVPFLLAAATGVLAAPSDKWSQPTIPDKDMPQPVNEGLDGSNAHSPYRNVFQAFLPLLEIDKTWCCNPYPAISLFGKYNKGMDPKWGKIEDCQTFDISEGQIYVRGFNAKDLPQFENHYAIMYAWYFPKIQEFPQGQKHDWQQIVQWYTLKQQPDTDPNNYEFVGVSYSTPDGYKYRPKDKIRAKKATGQLFIKYGKVGHKRGLEIEAAESTKKDMQGQRNMLAWDEFNQNEQVKAANNPDSFDKKVAPFADIAYPGHLQAAWKASNDYYAPH